MALGQVDILGGAGRLEGSEEECKEEDVGME